MKKIVLFSILAISQMVTSQTVSTVNSGGLLNRPHDVVVHSNGFIYIANQFSHQIYTISPGGVTSVYAGDGTVGSNNANGISASFSSPTGVCFNSANELFVTDYGNNLIRKIDVNGDVTTFAGSGAATSIDGTGVLASFNGPVGICTDANDNIYVAEQVGHRIRKITPAGVVTTVAGNSTPGSINANGAFASFNGVYDVIADASGNLYAADQNNNLIRKIAPNGDVSTVAGNGAVSSIDGIGTGASFSIPLSVSLDANGDLFVVDYGSHSVRKIDLNTFEVTTVAGNPMASANYVDGPAIGTARFNEPIGACFDLNGDLIIADYGNSQIRKLSGLPLAINELNNTMNIDLYPNPTSSNIQVSTDEKIDVIHIYNFSGRLIKSTSETIIDVTDLTSGVYHMNILTEKGLINKRFVKE